MLWGETEQDCDRAPINKKELSRTGGDEYLSHPVVARRRKAEQARDPLPRQVEYERHDPGEVGVVDQPAVALVDSPKQCLTDDSQDP